MSDSFTTNPASVAEPEHPTAPSPPPPRFTLIPAAILLVSMGMLALQVLQTVILSLQIFSQNAFLVVSFSLLGLGAGGSLATGLFRRGVPVPYRLLWMCALGFALFSVAAIALTSRTYNLLVLILVSLVPYAFIGLFLSILFRTWPRRANLYYFVDLVGASLGCLSLIYILESIGDAGLVVLLIGLLGALAALLLALSIPGPLPKILSLVALVGIGVLFPFSDQLFPFQPHAQKHYGLIQRDPDIESRLDWSRWGYLGRLDSVEPGPGIENFIYGWGAANAIRAGAEYRYLFASGDNWSYMLDFTPSPAYREAYIRNQLPGLPYHFYESPGVLNIGLGGGNDVFLALAHDARSVVGVEINPLMLEAVLERHPEFFDAAFEDPRVEVHEMDGRTYVDNTDRTFDVITLTAVDTGAGLLAGANMLSENYLYTIEAFREYLDLLKPGAVLFVFRPVTQLTRCIVTAAEALREAGATDLERHFAVISPAEDFTGDPWVGALVFRDPITAEQQATIVEGVEERNWRALYLPDYEAPEHYLQHYFALLAMGRDEAFLQNNQLNYEPITDDSPYFYDMSFSFAESDAGRLLATILIMVGVIGGILIFLPLAGLPIRGRGFSFVTTLIYFTGIGLGFMFVEIGMIQKLVLYLGHPSYSLTVSLFTILFFAGLGSIFSTRFSAHASRRNAVFFLLIVAAIVLYSLALDPILAVLPSPSLLIRSLFVVALLAPGSFFMGMPLPLMIRSMEGGEDDLIPWAWAINAYASVAGSVISVMVAMAFGFSALFLIGAACYLLVLLVYLRRAQRPPTLGAA